MADILEKIYLKEEQKELEIRDADAQSRLLIVESNQSGIQNDITNVSSSVTDLSGRVTNVESKNNSQDTAINKNASDISSINEKIPSAASKNNQLADKSFVENAIQTSTATFRGSYATWVDVPTDQKNYPSDAYGYTAPNNNDYIVVQDASGWSHPSDSESPLNNPSGTWRFKYIGTWKQDGIQGWYPEYKVSDAPLTSDQLLALNSGITAANRQQMLDDISSISESQEITARKIGNLEDNLTNSGAGWNYGGEEGKYISEVGTTVAGALTATAKSFPAASSTKAGIVKLGAAGGAETYGSAASALSSANAYTDSKVKFSYTASTKTLSI